MVLHVKAEYSSLARQEHTTRRHDVLDHLLAVSFIIETHVYQLRPYSWVSQEPESFRSYTRISAAVIGTAGLVPLGGRVHQGGAGDSLLGDLWGSLIVHG